MYAVPLAYPWSSPPPNTHNQHHQASFFTPQAHRTNTFATGVRSPFQPKSPSPLRASSNTGNLARRPGMHAKEKTDCKLPSDGQTGVENAAVGGDTQEYLHTPFLGSDATSGGPDGFPSPMFSSIFTPSTTKNDRSTPFAFQQNARESSASAQITSRVSGGREARKSDFLNRLRRSRRDERDVRGIESFEKAEYWRERRERERRLRREAMGLGWEEDDEMDGNAVEEEEEEQGALSPVDEELEVDELVEAYFDQRNDGQAVISGGQQEDGFADDGFEMCDDQAYEEAFVEVLSQEQQPILAFTHQDQRGGSSQLSSPWQAVGQSGTQQDGDMDTT